MIELNVEQIISLHTKMIQATGGLDGIKNKNLLESAVSTAFGTYFDTELYPSLEEKAARLCFSLISNHAFLDGNKRIGIFSMLILLQINDVELNCKDEDLVKLGLNVASSRWGYEDILRFIRQHQN